MNRKIETDGVGDIKSPSCHTQTTERSKNMKTNYTKTKVTVDEARASRIDRYLNEKGLMYEECGEQLMSFTAHFPVQRMEMDIQIVPDREGTAYVQAVLYNEYGKQLVYSEPEYALFGKFVLEYASTTYVAQMIPAA